MDGSRWNRLQDLFHDAKIHPPSVWHAYLLEASGGDETLVAEALEMLREDARGESLLDRGVTKAAMALLTTESLPGNFGPYRIVKPFG